MSRATPSKTVSRLIRRIDDASDTSGIKPANIVHRATGYQHLYGRLQRKADLLTQDIERIERFLDTLDKREREG